MVPARFVDFTKPVPESWQILDISMKYGTMIGIVVAFETTIPITNQVWGTHVSGGHFGCRMQHRFRTASPKGARLQGSDVEQQSETP